MTERQRPVEPQGEMPPPYDPEIMDVARGVLNEPGHETWLQIEANAIAVDQCCKDIAEHARHIS